MKKFIIIGILLVVICQTSVFAGTNMLVNMDNDMTFSANLLRYDDKNLNVRLTTGSSFTPIDEDSGKFNSFSATFVNTSVYKDCFLSSTPSNFPAKGVQLCTVVEVKYKTELRNPNVQFKPFSEPTLLYNTSAGGQTFLEFPEERKAPEDTWVTLKYVINPIAKNVKIYKNDILMKTVANSVLGNGDITDIRFYPRVWPEKDGAGLYPNGKASLNFDTEDGVIPLATQIIWTFDYIKIYQLTPYDIESSDPASGSNNISVDREYMVTFDTEMTGSTINNSNINLQLLEDGIFKNILSIVSFSDKTAKIKGSSQLEYFSKYRININENVKDENLFSLTEPKYVEFTTASRKVDEGVVLKNPSSPLSFVNGSSLSEGLNKCIIPITSSSAKTVQVIVATYSGIPNGVYSYIESAKRTVLLPSGDTDLETSEFTVPNDESCFAKVYIWDENGYPLVDAILCDIGKAAKTID